MRRTAAFLLALLIARGAGAADRARIRRINVGAQAFVTVVSALAQGKIRSGPQFWRVLGSGAAAGFGFHQSKILVSRGHDQQGWVLANVAASVTENAAAGKHPLAQIGYSVGPFRVRVPIPALDRTADSYMYVDASAYETGKLIAFYRQNDRVQWRSGMIAFERDTLYPAGDGAGPYTGRAFGIFPGVWKHAPEVVWRHEVVHAIQGLQGDAAEPSLRLFTYSPKATQRKRLIRFEHFELGLVNLANDAVIYRQPYEARWTELEAYRLTEDREP